MTFMIVNKLQLVTLVGSFLMMFVILESVRKQRLKEAYSLLWLIMGSIFIILSMWHDALGVVSDMIGIAYAPATLFLFLIVAVFMILIQYSIVLSKRTEQVKNLTQEIALLRQRFERLERECQSANRQDNK